MSADIVVSRELKSLQDELSATQRERAAAEPAPATPASPAEPTHEAADERELRDQLSKLMEEVTGFLEDAEKNVAAHPAQSVLIALAVGILIGRMLRRR